MLVNLKNPKTDSYQELKNIVLGTTFPWFFEQYSTHGEEMGYNNSPFLSHVVLRRPLGDLKYPRVRSPEYVDLFEKVLSEIWDYNDININSIQRINLNITLPSSDKRSTVPHTDHEFKHQNTLIYLTDAGGKTFINAFPGQEDEVADPKEDDAVVFDGEVHCYMLPEKSRRIVLVATHI